MRRVIKSSILSCLARLLLILIVIVPNLMADDYEMELIYSCEARFRGEGIGYCGFYSIGLDADERPCLLQKDTLYTLDGEGGIIPKFIFSDRKPYGHDFCFDDSGYVYLMSGSSGQVRIRKYNRDGQYIGNMKNGRDSYIPIMRENRRSLFLAKSIAYLPETGLFIYDLSENCVMIEYTEDTMPLLTHPNNVIHRMPLAGGREIHFRKINDSIREAVLTDHAGYETTTEYHDEYYQYIYSLDPDCEYYYVTNKENHDHRIIRKVRNGTVVFETEELPFPGFMYTAKCIIVDSKGTIYYYAGGPEINIYRWTMKQD